MKNIKYASLIICLLLTKLIMGQDSVAPVSQNNARTVYYVGDKLPEDIMEEFAPFSGKPIILDFWATYCGSCIVQFPKLKELQNEFEGKIQIVMVTNQSKAVVDKFTENNEGFRNLGLPSFVANQKIWDSFAFRSIPLQVWIDKQGYVRYITAGSNISANRIAAFLNGEELDIADATVNLDFDRGSPLWLEGNGRQNKYLKYYSFIMEYVPDAGNSQSIVRDNISGKIRRIEARNLPVDLLFAMAHGTYRNHNPFESPKRRSIETSDKTIFVLPEDGSEHDEWIIKNTYCYDIRVSEDRSDDVFEFMKTDLERYFKVSSSVEKREIPCLVIRTVDEARSIKTKGETPKIGFRSSDNKKISIVNRFMHLFIEKLEYEIEKFSMLPLINETGYDGNIDVELDRFPNDLKSLNINLEKYGLIISEEVRDIDMLVLKDL